MFRKKDDTFIEVWMSAKLAERRAKRVMSLDAIEAATYRVRDYGREFYDRRMIP